MKNTNKCNNCIGNPPTNNPMYVLTETGATQNYIKLYTPCENKSKTKKGPQVLLPYGSLIQATHR